MKKNQKMLLIGGAIAALVGVLIYNENKKKKVNASGYYNSTGSCRVCERENGETYFSKLGACHSGDNCIVSKRVKTLTSN